MGSGISSFSDISNNIYLNRLVSAEVLSPNNPFWNQLFSFSLKIPIYSSDYKVLSENSHGLLSSFLVNNSKTGNFGSLIRVFLARATELKSSVQCNDSIFTWQCHNAVFIIKCIIKQLFEEVSEDQVIEHVQIVSVCDQDNHINEGNLAEKLISSLVEIIVDVPLTSTTYSLHHETTSAVIVLTSSHILLMNGRTSIHACLLVKTLLKRFANQDYPPKANEGGSLILGLASGLWNVLTFGISGNEESNKVGDMKFPLATQSVLLLLILVNHHTTYQNKSTYNPYRQALLFAQNFQDPVESSPVQAVASFKIEYGILYSALCRHPISDHVTLLLYMLLHKNIDFRTYVLARTDIDILVLPVLYTLYNASQSNSHHIYMSLIVILILTEDEVFNKAVHDTLIKNISWYTERPICEISLGGLLILVVIRTVTYNMSKMRDRYLHTNCLAALANMSSQFRYLHPYVCQRLVSLFEMLAKRHSRLSSYLREMDTVVDSGNDISDTMSDISVVEEVLRMVLEILNSTVCNQLAFNHNLVYTLLYKRTLFQMFHGNPNFQDIIFNIEEVLSYLMGRLEITKRDPSVNDVKEVIQHGVLHFPKDRLKKFPELKFKYVEENDPEEFFIPYVWTLVYQKSGLYWKSSSICLFDANQSD